MNMYRLGEVLAEKRAASGAPQYLDASRGQLRFTALIESLLGTKRHVGAFGPGGMGRLSGVLESLLGTNRALDMVGVRDTDGPPGELFGKK